MSIEEAFREYQRWWQEEFLSSLTSDKEELADLVEEFEEEGWMDPLAGLVALSQQESAGADEKFGPFPSDYRTILATFGTGVLLGASPEPIEHSLVHPSEFENERSAALSWLSAEGRQRIRNDFSVEPESLVPILKPDDTTWVFLDQPSQNLFVFDHDFEGGYDKLLCGPKSFDVFFAEYFARSRNNDPLNGFNCWDDVE